MLPEAAANHLSWFGRGRERIELDGVAVFVGGDASAMAFPRRDADLEGAVECALEAGVAEVGCTRPVQASPSTAAPASSRSGSG